MKEIFKPIPDYPKYEVSNLGRIKSLFFGREKILKAWEVKNYLMVQVTSNKKRKGLFVHQLVAMTFLNHKPCRHKIVVDHKDFNTMNNRLDNLQLLTNRENCSRGKKDIGITYDKSRGKWISKIEIKYLINSVNNYLKKKISTKDIVDTYSGVRPLIEDFNAATKVTRDYVFDLNIILKKLIYSFY